MTVRGPYLLPPEKRDARLRARRLELWTLFWLATVTVVVYLAMGNSQALKTAWVDDVLSLVPPIAYLVSLRVRERRPDAAFPYGYRRVVNIAYLVAATTLSVVGLIMICDSAVQLATRHHPTIGTVEILGRPVWAGWLMIAAMVYGIVPPVILGRLKKQLARELHEKTLHTDAEINRADWMTGGAAIVGVLGIGLGWWWTDAAAAIVIAIDITRGGLRRLRGAVADLMDRRPTRIDSAEPDGVTAALRGAAEALPWVRAAAVRLREEGDVFAGEVFVVPAGGQVEAAAVERATAALRDTDWRLYDLVVTPVTRLDPRASRA